MQENQLIFGVHDPTIIECDGRYFLYSTDTRQPKTSGVPIRMSRDLVDWVFIGQALSGVPKEAKEWSNALGLWAPEIIHYCDDYRMYYSASTFGSTKSYIGLATAKTPIGPFKEQGLVVKTSSELCHHNAIDANVVTDKESNQWLLYGSFFGGLYILPLDKKTGKPCESGFGRRIALRPQSVGTAIEGGFIYYNPDTDYYYLFCSYDSLNDTYNIRVARSRHIDGPYSDCQGYAMDDFTHHPDEIGMKVLGSYQFSGEKVVLAPGHNSIFKRSDNQLFMVHHARRKAFSDEFFLNVRKLNWLSNGWPVVSPGLYEKDCKQESLDLAGDWEVISFDKTTDLKKSHAETIKASDYQKNDKNEFYWQGNLVKTWLEIVDGKIRQVFSGMSPEGYGIIAKKF
ncbi:arabinan endo-1,5-alpha-L-arabinosidase [Streptococcus gallolyticus]|uniref:arabinan endo-1,5-alpha-L-arabinosidase n=1 Tax=Streptococcus gallolyticus TaxID=315405 RepID=UPI00211CA119|nr:arabinan endo-1,5-alpha-L-arabinosidase [Streptococcus gallolyticus]MCQ9216446.1 arabinan endo-1,5-alpha-L-arabinosidase [Streptococcus gallolyticus]